MKRPLLSSAALAAAFSLFVARGAAEEMPVLHIDASRAVARVSPVHAGLMTEEINHSYDGGLYAELIQNRTFTEEAGQRSHPFGPWTGGMDPLAHWSIVKAPGQAVGLGIDSTVPLSAAVPVSLRVDATGASAGQRIGVANEGFWGIPVRPGTRYRVSFYARASKDFSGPLTVSLESPPREGNQETYAQAEVAIQGGEWRKYETTLTTDEGTEPVLGRFVIATERPGTFWLSLPSLFPPTWNNRPNGNRPDLMQLLADLHPKFMRFPGGGYLTGDTVGDRFDWKKTLGEPKDRPGHPSPWKYWSSDGMGLLEFLQWCEDLGMEPLLDVYSGQSPWEQRECDLGPELQSYVQDALDQIDYITGDPTTTEWGRRRAQDGHPTPFKLTYVEIGNEEHAGAAGPHYDERFTRFFDAIKARHPQLQVIAAGPIKTRTPDVIDRHFYLNAEAFFKQVGNFDTYDRKKPKIFIGEWATTEGSPTPNLKGALGDAAWMIGMERNADVVILQSYAPLLVNVNTDPQAWQWRTNLIGYDALGSFGSPSYYAQVMFNAHRGDEILAVSLGGPTPTPGGSTPDAAGLFSSVTRNRQTGEIYLKVVNSLGNSRRVRIEIAGAGALEPQGRMLVMSGKPDDTNSVDAPKQVVPSESPLDGIATTFEHEFPAYSISVIQLRAKQGATP